MQFPILLEQQKMPASFNVERILDLALSKWLATCKNRLLGFCTPIRRLFASPIFHPSSRNHQQLHLQWIPFDPTALSLLIIPHPIP